jgi:hypothetical protein
MDALQAGQRYLFHHVLRLSVDVARVGGIGPIIKR